MKTKPSALLNQDSEVEDILAYNIRVRRSSKGWTQKELARLTGISSAMVEHLESGRRWASKETIHALARALGCKTWELYRLPSTPHFEQLTWQHARDVLDREFSRLEFLNALPVGTLEDLMRLAEDRKNSAIEERIQSMMSAEKKPEYQTKSLRERRVKGIINEKI